MVGFNIVIEGADGTGKSSLIRGLKERLQKRGHQVASYSHPGSTPLGQEIRKLVKYRKDITIDRYTEQVMMAADLCNFISTILIPEVAAGKIVLNDRSNFVSGLIYGLAGGLSFYQIDSFQQVALALESPRMHLIVLNADYETIARRHHHDIVTESNKQVTVECKFQNRGDDFHRRVVGLYNELIEEADTLVHRRLQKFVAKNTEKMSVWSVDATQPAEIVLEQASSVVEKIVTACPS
jgi:dTMP kinase